VLLKKELDMKRILISSAVALAALASGSAFAQAYVGINAGVSNSDHGCGASALTGETTVCARDGTAFKLYGGYTLPGTDFAGELSYNNVGKFRANGDTASASGQGAYWGIGAAYRPTFGNGWGGVARLGEGYGSGKETYSLSSAVGSHSMGDWHPYYGLGVNYALTKHVKLEADWDNTRLTTKVPDYSSSSNTVNVYSIGASYGF
jgi:outer membrane protein W